MAADVVVDVVVVAGVVVVLDVVVVSGNDVVVDVVVVAGVFAVVDVVVSGNGVVVDVVVVVVGGGVVVVDIVVVAGVVVVVDVVVVSVPKPPSNTRLEISGIRRLAKQTLKYGGKKSQSATLRFHPNASSSSACSLAQRSPVAQSSSAEQSKPHSFITPDPDSWRFVF